MAQVFKEDKREVSSDDNEDVVKSVNPRIKSVTGREKSGKDSSD